MAEQNEMSEKQELSLEQKKAAVLEKFPDAKINEFTYANASNPNREITGFLLQRPQPGYEKDCVENLHQRVEHSVADAWKAAFARHCTPQPSEQPAPEVPDDCLCDDNGSDLCPIHKTHCVECGQKLPQKPRKMLENYIAEDPEGFAKAEAELDSELSQAQERVSDEHNWNFKVEAQLRPIYDEEDHDEAEVILMAHAHRDKVKYLAQGIAAYRTLRAAQSASPARSVLTAEVKRDWLRSDEAGPYLTLAHPIAKRFAESKWVGELKDEIAWLLRTATIAKEGR